jgi:hypothetical protein
MKSFTILTLFSMLSTGIQNTNSVRNATEQAASNVVHAFQSRSVEAYRALLPSLSDFHHIMDENRGLYGEFLAEAKREFAIQYEREVIPSAQEAFNAVIAEGNKRGIDWQAVEFVRVTKSENEPAQRPIRLDIVFRSAEKEYTLRIENAFIWNDQWKVTQFVELI